MANGELRRQRVDLGAIAEEVITGLRERDPLRVAEFRIADAMFADGDAGLLRTVLENLLGNAWKFTSRRAATLIELGSDLGIYFVRDNGAGFDPSLVDRLFQPFQRLHPSSEFEGTGIGLATVERIVARHDGKVWAEARPGEGATIFFTVGPSSGTVTSTEA